MKNLLLPTFVILFAMASCTQTERTKKSKTQAYLGLKEGGKWVWVTKSNGIEQYEYQGGEFKSVPSLTVDEKHTDHSFDIQFEGPGWESDKIGYRLYLDWRNAIDIFGKVTDTLVLHNVGLDGFDSYHEICDWGVDVLKVGSSLGIGSLAYWDGEKAIRVEETDSIYCEVESNGNNSVAIVDYYGWKIDGITTDVTTSLSIEKGSYLTQYDIELSNELPNLTTGIVKFPGTTVVTFDDLKPGWGCLATFGVQTLQNDNLGMCIFYKTDEVLKMTDDKYSHVVVLKPKNKKLTYYFGAAWEKDTSGVKTIDDFKALLAKQVQFLK